MICYCQLYFMCNLFLMLCRLFHTMSLVKGSIKCAQPRKLIQPIPVLRFYFDILFSAYFQIKCSIYFLFQTKWVKLTWKGTNKESAPKMLDLNNKQLNKRMIYSYFSIELKIINYLFEIRVLTNVNLAILINYFYRFQ